MFPERRNEQGEPEVPTKEELRMITGDAERLEERRTRLSDISWWMRCLAENIAVRSNHGEQTSGRFWQGRFKAVLLLDDTSLLACAAYVDLNPIRAALAETPEQSDYTRRQGSDWRLVRAVQAPRIQEAGFERQVGSRDARLGTESPPPAQRLDESAGDQREVGSGRTEPQKLWPPRQLKRISVDAVGSVSGAVGLDWASDPLWQTRRDSRATGADPGAAGTGC